VNLKPGTVYFIREIDLLTGHLTPYCKVGLVNSASEGDSSDRSGKHQTGNPRKLIVTHEVDSPAVSTLEKTLHRMFASHRVYGEWFDLGSEQLPAVLESAGRLAAQQREHVPTFEAAEALGDVESGDHQRPARSEDLEWHRRYSTANRVVQRSKKLIDSYRAILVRARDAGLDVSPFVQVRRSKPKFSKTRFRSNFPDLYDDFLVSSTSVSGTFRPSPALSPADAPLSVPADDVEAQFGDLLRRLPEDFNLLDDAHLTYLRIIARSASALWEVDTAAAHLRVLCGDSAGINDVVTWRRAPRATCKLDGSAVENAHPDEYNLSFAGDHNPQVHPRPMQPVRYSLPT
jgi:hypothetical protein